MDGDENNFDLDVNNYSKNELLGLCDIPGDWSEVSIIKATNTRLIQYNDNPPIKQFFQNIQNKLLNKQQEGFENWQDIKHTEEIEDDQEDKEVQEEEEGDEKSPFQDDDTVGKGLNASQMYKNQHEMGSEPPVPSRSNWKLGITDKTTSSLPIQQQSFLGAREVKEVPYAQGTINPRVKNMTHRLINLDSQYRSMPGGVSYKYPTPGCTTNYSVTLSESLKNTMSITLSSYEIPYSWVGIDPARGNNKLVIVRNETGASFLSGMLPDPWHQWACVTFNAGNWTLADINSVLETVERKDTTKTPPQVGYWSWDNDDGAALSPLVQELFGMTLTVNPDGFIGLSMKDLPPYAPPAPPAPPPPPALTNPLRPTVYFWGSEVAKHCSHNCTAISSNYQNSLGWLLGFRTQSTTPMLEPVTAPPWPDVMATASAFSVWARNDGWLGPGLDPPLLPIPPDKALVNWKMTQYIPYLYIILEDHNKNHNNKGVLNIVPAATVLNLPSYAKKTGMKLNETIGDYEVCDSSDPIDKPCPNYVDGKIVGGLYNEPQHLTQAQLFTITAIQNNRTFRSPYSIPTGACDSDIIAKITLPSLDYTKYGKFITDQGSSLQLNTRAYFGPVDLDRFTIKLIDNNGNLINLNNRDWSFTLRVEQMYQF
jgi:hypothetical protein